MYLISFLIFIFIFVLINSFYLFSCQQIQYNHNNKNNPPPPPNLEESIEVTLPLPTTNLPTPPPECTLTLLHHSITTQTIDQPSVIPYSPPCACPSPWSHVVLHLSGSVSGSQNHHHVGAVWLGGVELLRTSTPKPFDNDNGTFWNVDKDITRYSSLLQQYDLFLSMVLETFSNDEFTGVYHVNLTILFYKHGKLESSDACMDSEFSTRFENYGGIVSYDQPANLVIPLTNKRNDAGFWFQVQEKTPLVSNNVVIPANAWRIVVELYVSSHGDDEFWYSNPPTTYIETNNLTTNQGNGAFREVYVKVDGNYVASDIPFPVVFPGGINPLFWKPVVAIGAFNIPTYDFDLTPFLGSISDGKSHDFKVEIAHAINFWLVGGNVHVWLDRRTSEIEARMSIYQPPRFVETSKAKFKQLDGVFQTKAQRRSLYSGWVGSCGNLTTTIARRISFRNSIMFQNQGTYKTVMQRVNERTQVRMMSDTGEEVARRKFKKKTSLSLIILTMPAAKNETSLIVTKLSIALNERLNGGMMSSNVQNSLQSGGWILVKNESVVSGQAETQQLLNYRGSSGCFIRSVGASGGRLSRDETSTICPHLYFATS